MKKQTLLLMAGGMLAFASCNNNAPAGGGMSQAQVDSEVNARVDAIRAELTAQNDSLINAMATMKADSMIAAMKGGAPAPKPAAKAKPAAKPGRQDVPATEVAKPAEPVNPKDARFNGTESKHNKDARFNADAAKEEAAKKKADRFK